MAEPTKVEIYVIVDEAGNSAVGETVARAAEVYEEDVQKLEEAECLQYYFIELALPHAKPTEFRGNYTGENTPPIRLERVGSVTEIPKG